jgi:hypothetical protein
LHLRDSTNFPSIVPSLGASGGILVDWNINEAGEVTHGSSLAISARHSPELTMQKLGNSLLSMGDVKGREEISLSPGYTTTKFR